MTKLIIPTVSVGNIPQLTVDLILANNPNFTHIDDTEIIDEHILKFLYPFVGSFDNKFLKSLEIFEDSQSNTYILQQRSPIIRGYEINFYTLLVERLNKKGIQLDELVILDSLSGSDPHIDLIKSQKIGNLYALGGDKRISIGQLNENVNEEFFETARKSLDKEIEKLKQDQKLEHKYDDINFQFTEVLPHIDAKMMRFTESSFQSKVFVDSLVVQIASAFIKNTPNIRYFNMLSYEGDNSLDAVIFMKLLVDFGVFCGKEGIKIPSTWDNLYGFKHPDNLTDQSIYS